MITENPTTLLKAYNPQRRRVYINVHLMCLPTLQFCCLSSHIQPGEMITVIPQNISIIFRMLNKNDPKILGDLSVNYFVIHLLSYRP